MTARPLKKPPEKIKRAVWEVITEIELSEDLKFAVVEPGIYGAIAE